MKGRRAKRRGRYMREVSIATVATVERYGAILPRHGSCSLEARWVVDHILPKAQGFKRDEVDPVWMGSEANLRWTGENFNNKRGHRMDQDAIDKYEEFQQWKKRCNTLPSKKSQN